MQKLLLHIILFSYAIVMFKPAFPYLNDVIAHALFLQQHLATVHFENGKYHVHKEEAKNSNEENSGKNSLPEKKKTTTEEYVDSIFRTTVLYSSIKDVAYGTYLSQKDISPYLPYNYPPPRD